MDRIVTPPMTHAQIDEHDIASRYALNKLSSEEQAAFEAHLVDCPECLDRIDLAHAFRDGLRKVAVADTALAEVALRKPQGQPARPARPGWSPLALRLAAAAALIIASGALAMLIPVRRQLARANLTAADWQRRYDEAGKTAGALRDRLAAAERELQQRPAAPLIGASVPVFSLSIVRSGEGGPPARLSFPASASFVVLSLEIPGTAGFLEYRASLVNSAGQPVWHAEQLRPASPDALGIGLSTAVLQPGDYVLTVEGVERQVRTVPIGRYPFRVTSSR